jgi:hypothetical protein
MKRCLRSHLRALVCCWRLALLPPALGLLLGWEASAALGAYVRRAGPADARSALAFVLDIRHFVPLAGAAWAAAFLGAEFDARASAFPLSRGCSRFQVFGSRLLLFFLGCALISAAAQLTSAPAAVSGWQPLPAGFLLRCLSLRLALDLGMMAPCAAIVSFAGASLYGRALAGLYGLLLWRLMGSHYGLWLPEAGAPGLIAFWPLAALPLSLLGCFPALRRKEF